MDYTTKNRLKTAAFSCWMAFLFMGGVAFGGSEFAFPGFPWGPVIGATCFVILGGTAYLFRNQLP